MDNYQIDDIDRKILSFLVKDARMAYLEIARECGVSGAAIHQRVRKLEANGVITGSRLLVKPSALGLNVCAFVSISISQANKYLEVTESLKKIPEVVECHFTTGHYTMMIKVYARDNEHLMSLVNDRIQHIEGVAATETLISLEQSISRTLPIYYNE
jgi:Lrp/AsnC family transcriptional regulator for asnA, asnC and gidA